MIFYKSFVISAIWGALWALFIHKTRVGRWLRLYRTWVTVVIGVGVDIVIVGWLWSWTVAQPALIALVGSGIPIIFASLLLEYRRDAD